MGVGGTWNLNEEKSPDAEIIASGVYVGFLIYTSVQLFTYLFGTTKHKRELSDTIMNVVGTLLWLGVAGTALHYWHGYQAPHDFANLASERMVIYTFTHKRVVYRKSKLNNNANITFFLGWIDHGLLDPSRSCSLLS